MGFLDWLFGRKKKKARKGSTAAPAATPAAMAPDDDEEEDDENFSEATTFISRRLSPVAQREIKNLRDMLAQGVQLYDWVGNCTADCNKIVASGPFRVGDGLTGQAPVPGREGCAQDNCTCALAPHEG
ncbi:MAG: hypothetical protein AAF458_18545 [Pseudomonadota bacterium]